MNADDLVWEGGETSDKVAYIYTSDGGEYKVIADYRPGWSGDYSSYTIYGPDGQQIARDDALFNNWDNLTDIGDAVMDSMDFYRDRSSDFSDMSDQGFYATQDDAFGASDVGRSLFETATGGVEDFDSLVELGDFDIASYMDDQKTQYLSGFDPWMESYTDRDKYLDINAIIDSSTDLSESQKKHWKWQSHEDKLEQLGLTEEEFYAQQYESTLEGDALSQAQFYNQYKDSRWDDIDIGSMDLWGSYLTDEYGLTPEQAANVGRLDTSGIEEIQDTYRHNIGTLYGTAGSAIDEQISNKLKATTTHGHTGGYGKFNINKNIEDVLRETSMTADYQKGIKTSDITDYKTKEWDRLMSEIRMEAQN